MKNDKKSEPAVAFEMKHRKITLGDGRYLIFYDFDEPPANIYAESEKVPRPDRKTANEEENV